MCTIGSARCLPILFIHTLYKQQVDDADDEMTLYMQAYYKSEVRSAGVYLLRPFVETNVHTIYYWFVFIFLFI